MRNLFDHQTDEATAFLLHSLRQQVRDVIEPLDGLFDFLSRLRLDKGGIRHDPRNGRDGYPRQFCPLQ